jgi:hypothetical protein
MSEARVMGTPVFDYDEFYRLIERFADEVPRILAGHHTTGDLVSRFYGLLDAVESVFTVAVVGQMRSGKSSLLNSLVGADLAVTGVNETTATINWFKYGEGEQCRRFRVVWKDRPAEEFPQTELQHWVGDSERAKATRYLELFSSADFLRQANVVDTPGTRSVLESHEATVQEFLAAKHDAETRRQGGAADAIVYVLMPVARETDRDLLGVFEQNTRLPGSSPYNSLAVVHKWEMLSVENPLAEVQRKVERISKIMGDLVSAVIPVSAPLAWAAEQFADSFWSQVLELTANCGDDVLEELLVRDRDFTHVNIPGCPLDAATRQKLYTTHRSRLPWPSLKVIVQIAAKQRPGNVADLRTAIRQASGIDLLRSQLQRRFFARTKMIKVFSVLSKALEPCQVGSRRLRNHKVEYSRLLDGAQSAMASLSQHATSDATLAPVRRYLEETRSIVEDDLRRASETLRKLDELAVTIQDAYGDMNADLQMLELIDANHEELGVEWARSLRHLFGFAGPELKARISPLLESKPDSEALDVIEQTIGDMRRLLMRSKGQVRNVAEHAVARLEQIADWLEDQARTDE